MVQKNELQSLLNLICEYHGVDVSDSRLLMFEQDLKLFSIGEIRDAWGKYRLKNSKFPMPKDLIDNIQDGRPSAQEAWGMIPKTEEESVVWSEEMRIAFGACYDLICQGQITNAFFVFREKYEELLMKSRTTHVSPKWEPSFGYRKDGRALAIKEAVEKGRISVQQARSFFPEFEVQPQKKQIGGSFAKLGDTVKIDLNSKEITT